MLLFQLVGLVIPIQVNRCLKRGHHWHNWEEQPRRDGEGTTESSSPPRNSPVTCWPNSSSQGRHAFEHVTYNPEAIPVFWCIITTSSGALIGWTTVFANGFKESPILLKVKYQPWTQSSPSQISYLWPEWNLPIPYCMSQKTHSLSGVVEMASPREEHL